MEEAEALCDRVAIMDHGHILEMGTVADLVHRRFQARAIRFDSIAALGPDQLGGLAGVDRVAEEDDETVLYSTDVPATISGLLDATSALGVEARNLAVRPASLEDVFLDLTGRALRD
jgi:ABC-2 type transport system ATP-binding protein